MKSIIKIFSGLIFLFVLVLLVSMFLPKEKTTINQITIDKPFFFVWAAITNHYEEPAWRTDLDTVIQMEERDTGPVWKEYFENGDSISWQITTEVSNKLLVRHIIDNPTFEGTMWAINVMNSEGGTIVRIVEDQIVKKPLCRYQFLSTPHDYDVKLYLTNLQAKFNQPEEENSYGW
jgi:hypothetical protein